MTPDTIAELERLEREYRESHAVAYELPENRVYRQMRHDNAVGKLLSAVPELIVAAKESERLREQVRVLREALRPVARQAIELGAMELSAYIVRDAREALAATAPEGKP